jgi:anthranilate synthase component II
MSAQVSVLFIDNFDSFTFNLVDELRKRGALVSVWRNDLPAAAALARALGLPAPRLLVLSPGPGAPAQAGCCVELIRLAAGRIPLFGVCLGHQAIVEAFGGTVGSAGEVVHGKAARVEHGGAGMFQGLPSPLRAGRYHSLAAIALPDELAATAHCGPVVMAVEHRRLPVWGVQFHPESILTPSGGELLERVLEQTRRCFDA